MRIYSNKVQWYSSGPIFDVIDLWEVSPLSTQPLRLFPYKFFFPES